MLTNLGGPRLWDRDEPRNAGCAREMLARRDWVVPTFDGELRTHKPRFLAVSGKNDPFFLPQGAKAFQRDIPDAMVHFFDTGHFALEDSSEFIAQRIREFLG